MSRELRQDGREARAFGELYERHSPQLYRVARLFMPDAEAEKCVEKVGLEMYGCIENTNSSTVSWFRAARAELLRIDPSVTNLGDLLHNTHKVAVLEGRDGNKVVEKLAGVKGTKAEVIFWRFIGELHPADVARVMDIKDEQEVFKLQREGLKELNKTHP